MPGCWGCKDLDSTFQYANAEYAKIMGLTHHLDAVGRTDFDMPWDPVSSYAEIFREQDQSVLYSKKILQTLDIHPFADGQWRAYIFTKKLWLSGQTYLPALPKDHHPLPHTQGSTILGTIFHGLEITHTHSERLCSALAKWNGSHLDSSGHNMGPMLCLALGAWDWMGVHADTKSSTRIKTSATKPQRPLV